MRLARFVPPTASVKGKASTLPELMCGIGAWVVPLGPSDCAPRESAQLPRAVRLGGVSAHHKYVIGLCSSWIGQPTVLSEHLNEAVVTTVSCHWILRNLSFQRGSNRYERHIANKTDFIHLRPLCLPALNGTNCDSFRVVGTPGWYTYTCRCRVSQFHSSSLWV